MVFKRSVKIIAATMAFFRIILIFLGVFASCSPYVEEVHERLGRAGKSERLRHSAECDPLRNARLFHRLMNLNRDNVTEELLSEIESEIKLTCDWKRYMVCDPMRKRCVCSANAIWLPLDSSENKTNTNNNGTKGRCALKPKSPCSVSQEEHNNNTKENPLGINPPFVPCALAADTHCHQGTCQCIKPGSVECDEVTDIFKTRMNHLINLTTEIKWAGIDQPCDYGSELTVDTRTHTLRTLQVNIMKWKAEGTSLERVCDITLGLECQPKNNDTLETVGTCKCSKRATWYNGSCHGEQGSLCELQFWAESKSVGVYTPCMPELSCITTHHIVTQREMHACCYVGIYGYRSLDFDEDVRLFCPLDAPALLPLPMSILILIAVLQFSTRE